MMRGGEARHDGGEHISVRFVGDGRIGSELLFDEEPHAATDATNSNPSRWAADAGHFLDSTPCLSGYGDQRHGNLMIAGLSLTRRKFLVTTLSASAALGNARELSCDVAVIGGSLGGCAAALAAARNGMRVILTEECRWIGGQVTSQAVPPDEHPWIEQFGSHARLPRSTARACATTTVRHYPLTAEARARWNLNPGRRQRFAA